MNIQNREAQRAAGRKGLTMNTNDSQRPADSLRPSGSALERCAGEILVCDEDRNIALGSGELLPCPFCGAKAFSTGEELPNNKFRWIVMCEGPRDPGISVLWNNCAASVWGIGITQREARTMAVKRWNRRPNDKLTHGGPTQ